MQYIIYNDRSDSLKEKNTYEIIKEQGWIQKMQLGGANQDFSECRGAYLVSTNAKKITVIIII